MNTVKAASGAVGIDERQGKWRIRLPRAIAKDSARYISTRLNATPENLKKVQVVAWQIEEDLTTGNFDANLDRYSSAFKPQLTVIKPAKEPDLITLWDVYCEHRKSQVAITTFKKEYLLKFPSHIKKFPTQDISQAIAIREHLLKTVSADTTKRDTEERCRCNRPFLSS